MKKLTFSLLLVFSSLITMAQIRKATGCGNGCYAVTAQIRNDRACGGNFDYTYTVTNHSSESLDIALYVQKRNGEWKSLGLINDVSAGKVLKDAFWSCDLSGRYVFYYRSSGSGDRFPTQYEINSQVRGY